MGLKDRLRRLRDRTGPLGYDLVCPSCGAGFAVSGAAPLELVCAEWLRVVEHERYEAEKEPGLKAAVTHEHDPFDLVDRATGRRVVEEMPAFRY